MTESIISINVNITVSTFSIRVGVQYSIANIWKMKSNVSSKEKFGQRVDCCRWCV